MQKNDINEIIIVNKSMASKKKMKTSLMECLNDLTKDRLNKIAAYYTIAQRSKMKKDELIEAICKVINEAKTIDELVVDFDINSSELLRKALSNKSISCVEEELSSYENYLAMSLVFTYIDEDDVLMVMPNEIKELFNGEEKLDDISVSPLYDIVSKYIVGFAEAYGIYEADFLIETFNSHHEEKLNIYEFNLILDKFMMENGKVKFYNQYIAHELLFSINNGIEQLLMQREGKEYYKLSLEKVLKYANGIFIDMTEAHNTLKAKLNTVVDSEMISERLFVDICDSLFFGDLNTQFIVGEFNNYNIKIDTIKEFEIILSMIRKVNDNTRKWGNRGFTNLELTQIASKKIVGRNDPCICGSGKKYKKCCGR